MTKKIVIATKNLDKLRELEIAFDGLPVEILSLADIDEFPDAIEDGNTFEENAEIKARFFREKTGLACLADDSGLEVDALDGRPGVYSARFAGYHAHDVTNNYKLVEEMEKVGASESPARYYCALCFIDTDGTKITGSGIVNGTIKLDARGEGGFGYDPYFYIEENKTMAELTTEEKDLISHRGAALRNLVPKLREWLSCSLE